MQLSIVLVIVWCTFTGAFHLLVVVLESSAVLIVCRHTSTDSTDHEGVWADLLHKIAQGGSVDYVCGCIIRCLSICSNRFASPLSDQVRKLT
jgi:hypothetical protein|eukprot:SAG25_NODE_123_length_14620_cov_73.222161_10_plen_92_part_00